MPKSECEIRCTRCGAGLLGITSSAGSIPKMVLLTLDRGATLQNITGSKTTLLLQILQP